MAQRNVNMSIGGTDPIKDAYVHRKNAETLRYIVEQVQAMIGTAQSSTNLMPSGAIVPFNLTSANMTDSTKFLQAGSTSGLGVGTYTGWALCNGNNGTPNLDGVMPRWSVAAAGTTGGLDTQSVGPGTYVTTAIGTVASHTHTMANHTHTSATTDSHILTTSEMPSHQHAVGLTHDGSVVAGNLQGGTTGNTFGWTNGSGTIGANSPDNGLSSAVGSGSGHSHTVSTPTGTPSPNTSDATAPAFTGSSSAITGTSASFDNRPAFSSLVPLMRL